MSRKSERTIKTREAQAPSVAPTTSSVIKRPRLLRSVTESPSTPLANGSDTLSRRKSQRTLKVPPLYNIDLFSSEEGTPQSDAKSAKRTTRTLEKTSEKTTRAQAKQPREVEKEESPSTSQDNVRRSSRAPKPKLWSDDNDEASKTPSSANKNKQSATTPKVGVKSSAEENAVTPRKSARTQEKLSKKVVEEDSRTGRATRRTAPTLEKETAKESKTPAKLAGESTPTSNKRKKVQAKPDIAQTKTLEWKFNVYGIPKCPLPCRESQFEEIWKFLFENISERNSGCMYVSGVPGTGKTVIVQAVVDTMKKINQEKKKNAGNASNKNLSFDYLYINGLTLSSPEKIWKRMFKGLELKSKSKSISTKEALKRLDSHFEGLKRDPMVLVVDELDQILDKQQSILYQLLEWSSHSKNMFSFVAIFNTMSLPEHGLAMRNYSRMGFKRAVFPPYHYEQLQTIVSAMLNSYTTARLNTESVSLLSRKVAAISGDARRALEIARRAMEIAEASGLSGIQAVSSAFTEIFSSAKIETLKHTSLLEQLVLKQITIEVRCSGIEEVLIAKVYENVLQQASFEGMHWPKDEILKALMRLAVMRLVIVEDNCSSLHKRVLLKVPVEDVNFAFGIHTDLEA